MELLYNVSSVLMGALLFYIMDIITTKDDKVLYDPALQKAVPFIVFYANCKLLKDHMPVENGYP